MNTKSITKEKLINELHDLKQEYDLLKSLFEKDMAKCNRTESTLCEINTKLTLAMQGGNMAWWEMDVVSGNVTFSNRKVEMLGYSPENFIHYKDFTALVHPEDYKKIMNAMKGHFDGAYEKYETEYRIRAKSGEYIWFYDFGSVVKRDLNGRPLLCTGFVYDITDRKKAEEVLRVSEHMLQTVLDHFPGLIFWKDSQLNYLGCNQSFATGAGLNSPADIIGKSDFDLPWSKTEASFYRKDDSEVMENGKEKLHISEKQHQANGQVIWFETSKIPLRDSLGQVFGIIGVSNDISKLKAAEQELLFTNKELVFQNEEKERRSIELIKALDRAEESDRLKSAFLANMSHEIRTPMNGILGFANLLKEDDLSDDKKQKYIKIIEKSGVRLLNIVTEIMDISKIESGQMKVNLKMTDVNKQMEYIHHLLNPDAEDKKIRLSFNNSIHTKAINFITDADKLYSILTNLIRNAIKYTDKGSIGFGYDILETKHKTSLQFFVKDTGIGIPKDRQQAIFDRFIQADVIDIDARQGAGLGLSISKAFVEMLGGRIWVESTLGVGSTFYFTIPEHNGGKVFSEKSV